MYEKTTRVTNEKSHRQRRNCKAKPVLIILILFSFSLLNVIFWFQHHSGFYPTPGFNTRPLLTGYL
jgi:hypothetical protein